MSDPSLLGHPQHFEFEGKNYPLSNPRTFEEEAAFVAWVQAEAYRALLPHRKMLGEAEFGRQVAGWRQDLGAKVYAWGKQACVDALWSDEGVKEMAWIQFQSGRGKCIEGGRKPDADISREVIERIMKDPAKGTELTRLILGIKESPADPNSSPSSESPCST